MGSELRNRMSELAHEVDCPLFMMTREAFARRSPETPFTPPTHTQNKLAKTKAYSPCVSATMGRFTLGAKRVNAYSSVSSALMRPHTNRNISSQVDPEHSVAGRACRKADRPDISGSKQRKFKACKKRLETPVHKPLPRPVPRVSCRKNGGPVGWCTHGRSGRPDRPKSGHPVGIGRHRSGLGRNPDAILAESTSFETAHSTTKSQS